MPGWAIILITLGSILVYGLLAAVCYGVSCAIQGEWETYGMLPAFVLWPIVALIFLGMNLFDGAAKLGRKLGGG